MKSKMALDAEFGRSDGRAHHLRFKDFDPTKNVDEIKASLSKLTKLSIFDKNDVSLFDEVRHATAIEKKERAIFDNKKTANKSVNQTPMTSFVVEEPIEIEPTPAQAVHEKSDPIEASPIPQVQEPVNYIEYTEAIEDNRAPEDLNITNEFPKPGWLIQTIELPANVHSWDLSKEYVVLLLNACLPARTTLEDIAADDQSVPAKLIVSATIEEASSKIEQVDVPNKESPPEKSKKKRNRLLERVRKRE